MANVYTQISNLGTNLVQTAYDRLVEFALRSQPLFRSVADKRPAQQAMPGSSVVFQFYVDLATQTSTLSEAVDPDAIALSATNTVTVTLAEYGASTLATRKLSLFALSDVDPALANVVAFNMADSLDVVALTELRGGTHIIREAAGNMTGDELPTSTAALTAVAATDLFKSRDARAAVAKLRKNKAVPRRGNLYWCGIHPEVSLDLRQETGAAAWRDPHITTAQSSIWAGEIGEYEGAFYVETPRAYNAVDGGTGGNTVRVFRTIFAGQQGLAEAVAEEPHVVIGPVVDKLMRARPVGWYGVLGWKRYREDALYRVETSCSIDSS